MNVYIASPYVLDPLGVRSMSISWNGARLSYPLPPMLMKRVPIPFSVQTKEASSREEKPGRACSRGESLCLAVREGRVSDCRAILLDGEDIHEEKKMEAFALAAKRGDRELMAFIVCDSGPISNQAALEAFSLTASMGYSDIARTIAEDLSITGKERLIAVCIAEGWGCEESAVTLIKRGQFMDVVDVHGRFNERITGEVVNDALTWNLQNFKTFLRRGTLSVADRGRALIEAAKMGQLEKMRLLAGSGTISEEDRRQAYEEGVRGRIRGVEFLR